MIHKIKLTGTDSEVEVNDEVCLVDIERGCPLFFKTKFGKRETYTVHRGCLIVRNTVAFDQIGPTRRTTVYLFFPKGYPDNPTPDTYCVSGSFEISSIQQAKKVIDRILYLGEYHYGMLLSDPKSQC